MEGKQTALKLGSNQAPAPIALKFFYLILSFLYSFSTLAVNGLISSSSPS